MSVKPRDSDSVGICSYGIDIDDTPQTYYEQPIGATAPHPPNVQHAGGTNKILPYVNNRHLSKDTALLAQQEDWGHAKTYYNPARDALYARYSQNDWHFSNQSNYNTSSTERNAAGAARANSDWCINQTEARTKNRQKLTTAKLEERVEDINFWKKELETEIKNLKGESINLKSHNDALDKTLTETRLPLELAQECLRQREKRTGIDLVKDDVEKALNKEAAIVKQCQEKMRKLLGRAKDEAKLIKAGLHSLEVDNQHKTHAHGVDNSMRQLTNSSTGIGYHPGIEYFDNTITIPVSWAKYTQTNLKRSQRERDTSEKLRNDIDECMRNCLNAMWNQFNQVNNAFKSRVRETTDAKSRLQAHLNRTMEEIAATEKNIESIRQAIRDKEAPMKVAQTRLEERSRRINVELCNDPVMKTLLREVEEIRESVRILKSRLKPADLALARLIKTMNCLKHDIGVKETSLEIDNNTCLAMRKAFPMSSVSTYFDKMPVPS